jgi:hypothetical protein
MHLGRLTRRSHPVSSALLRVEQSLAARLTPRVLIGHPPPVGRDPGRKRDLGSLAAAGAGWPCGLRLLARLGLLACLGLLVRSRRLRRLGGLT